MRLNTSCTIAYTQSLGMPRDSMALGRSEKMNLKHYADCTFLGLSEGLTG